MNKRKWFLITDFKSMLVPYLMYIAYLLALCFLDKPFVMGLQWNMHDAPPEVEVNIYPYVLIGTALFSTLCTAAPFKETYRENSVRYIISLRPTMFQVLYKRIVSLFMAMALPLAAFLGYSLWRMNGNYTSHISDPDFYVAEKSALYGYPVPEASEYYVNIFVQLILALLAFILINHAVLALSGNENITILTFISYCIAEYFGFRYVIPKHGLITSAIEPNFDITKLIASYSITHIVLSVVCLMIIIIVTKRKLTIKYI